ncbi:monovalent cation/H+ antiporter complex subunit F [Klenkia sp. PcliD-1-E]|uniref:monovalent cation/H+ antiporter complex subunit F n=1 Tax=Klenkia sp. PcliD-1-E TaxID=2954492 RepID=UPI0020978801|nr:monovalent cation/H+ antiporter complex subunit F [Klenkia sp. PcliD-1-E]MCO7219596.1 monovalent cation/H+ antiporter complex subunit F [Klenkia sp. PcliD-1-E]
MIVQQTVLDALLVLLAVCLVMATVRAVRGPSDADRVLGVDFGFLVTLGAVALLAVRLRTPALLDLVLIGTLVGFLATIALARLVVRRSR